MDKTTQAKLDRQVVKQFPEMSGVRPTIRRESKGDPGLMRYNLTYKGKADLPGGRKITRIVRVVADENGQIIRISTSK